MTTLPTPPWNPVLRAALSMALMVALGLAAAPASAAPAGAGNGPGPTLQAVRTRGTLLCGVGVNSVGFAVRDAQGRWSGFDVDFCRALAAATLGDASRVRIVPVPAATRMEVLARGEVDVLFRNTTVNYERDTQGAVWFPVIQYYDGQGFMVRRALKVDSARRLGGVKLCMQTGTTSLANATRYLDARGIAYVPVRVEDEVATALASGRCDAITSDTWDLAGARSRAPNPDDWVILPELISKEPLGPVVRRDDEGWFLVVRWLVHGLVAAEEAGITRENADQPRTGEAHAAVRQLLGVEGDFGRTLGLDNRWMRRSLLATGNYGQIFERNLGQGSPLKLGRGLNALWTQGGLLYAPPLP